MKRSKQPRPAGLTSTQALVLKKARASLSKHGVIYLGDFEGTTGFAQARLCEVLADLASLGHLNPRAPIVEYGPLDEPDPITARQIAEIEARRKRLRDAKDLLVSQGLLPNISPGDLDSILPPVTARRASGRKEVPRA